jgi:hypothetical protein
MARMVRIVVRTPECGGWATVIDDNGFFSEGWVDRAGPPFIRCGGYQPGAKSGGREAATGGRGYVITSER